MAKDGYINVRVDDRMMEELRLTAVLMDINVSKVVRLALDGFLKKTKSTTATTRRLGV